MVICDTDILLRLTKSWVSLLQGTNRIERVCFNKGKSYNKYAGKKLYCEKKMVYSFHMLIFNPLKYDFLFSGISETMKATMNLGESYKQEFFKGIRNSMENTELKSSLK